MNEQIYNAFLRAEGIRMENEAILLGVPCMRVGLAGGSIAINSRGEPVSGTFKATTGDDFEKVADFAAEHAGSGEGRLAYTANVLKHWKEHPEEREKAIKQMREAYGKT